MLACVRGNSLYFDDGRMITLTGLWSVTMGVRPCDWWLRYNGQIVCLLQYDNSVRGYDWVLSMVAFGNRMDTEYGHIR